jgi:hypothetical protein
LDTSGSGTLSITPAGAEETDRLLLPFWKRWATDRAVAVPLLVGFTSAVVGAVVSGLVGGLITLLKG